MDCNKTGNVKNVVLITLLSIYTVLCGIIIADCGTSSVAGRTRPGIVAEVMAKIGSIP